MRSGCGIWPWAVICLPSPACSGASVSVVGTPGPWDRRRGEGEPIWRGKNHRSLPTGWDHQGWGMGSHVLGVHTAPQHTAVPSGPTHVLSPSMSVGRSAKALGEAIAQGMADEQCSGCPGGAVPWQRPGGVSGVKQ